MQVNSLRWYVPIEVVFIFDNNVAMIRIIYIKKAVHIYIWGAKKICNNF